MQRFVLAICTAAFLSSCAPQKPTTAVEKAPLQKFEYLIDWQAEPTYLGVYHAKRIGLFEKLGLDVSIVQSLGANQAVSAVASGRYQITTASGGATVLAYNNNAAMASLAVLYPRIPSVVYGLSKSGIKKPQDLLGKKIGIYPGSITSNEFEAFRQIQHLDAKRLKIISLSGPDIPLLISGQLDAVLHYTEMSPVTVSQDPNVKEGPDGKKVFELLLSDYGVGGYGLNIVTSRDALNHNADKLKTIAAATVEGYRAGCADPAAAVAGFVKEFPDKTPAYVTESWSRVCRMLGPNPGRQTAAGWQETIDLYQKLGLLKQTVTPQNILP